MSTYKTIDLLWLLAPQLALKLTLPDPPIDPVWSKVINAGLFVHVASIVEDEELKMKLHNEAARQFEHTYRSERVEAQKAF